MSVKIRLSRHGKKQNPYYHIVIADSRAPRDGKFIERIGHYDPTTNPATIKLDFDRALSWLEKGAQPTDTCRAILSYEGVLMKQHLLNGVKKGAFDEAIALTRFETWKSEKLAKIQTKRDKLSKEETQEDKKRFEAEAKVKAKRAEAIAERNAKLIADEKAKLAEAEQQEEVPQVEDTLSSENVENNTTEQETPPTEA
jgi:small subunit ribosomal protein S16